MIAGITLGVLAAWAIGGTTAAVLIGRKITAAQAEQENARRDRADHNFPVYVPAEWSKL